MQTQTRTRRHMITLLSAGMGILATAAWSLDNAPRLVLNGAVASNNVRTIQGQAYVPIQDIAKALNMNVIVHNGKYELVPSGGTGQLETNHTGKLGQDVFTGKWRFAVTGIERADRYRKRLTPYYRSETEAQDGDELVIMHCRVKNGTKVKDSLVYEKWEGNNTALTDTEGHSYEPVMWDVRADQIAPEGAAFLPGAAVDFSLVFRVPKGTELKDLIFTAMRYDDRVSFVQKKHPPTDIRYGLR